MKQFKVLVALVLVAMMSLALVGSAMASESALADGSIKITPPSGLASDASNTYKIYKVFDATNSGTSISYKLCAGDSLSSAMTTAGFSVDTAGNVSYSGSSLTSDAIAAIAAFVTETDLVATLTATGTTPVTATGLGAGYYYIATTTGTTVTIDSTNPSAAVEDKNTVPTVDKKITGASSVDEDGKKALAQVGTTVNYSAEITIGKGAKGYVFHDTMETGLTYNNDAAVTGVAATTGEGESAVTNYTVGKVGTDTFTITFSDDYIKTLTVGSKLTVTYSATVNDNAITTDPLNNTCYVSYGDSTSTNRTPDSEADVYEAKFTVHKNQPAQQGEDGAVLNSEDNKYYKPLAGAGFVIKNASNKYYKLTTTTTDGKTTNVVTWVDSINDATEYTSDTTGAVPSFTGLANGTYTLVEKTVPAGFNKAADRSFTVQEHVYTTANLEQQATVTNNAGQELPSTGGIGTTIFYIVGAVLVLGAAAVILARRKAEQQ